MPPCGHRRGCALALTLALSLAACTDSSSTEVVPDDSERSSVPTDQPVDTIDPMQIVGRTNVSAEGNRVVPGALDLIDQEATEVVLPFDAAWVLPITGVEEVSWIAIADSGDAVAITGDGTVEPIAAFEGSGMPLAFEDGAEIKLVSAELFVDSDLPDSNLVSNDSGARAWLTEATDRYAHGALGDDLEAASIVIERRVVGDPMDDVGDDLFDQQAIRVELADTVVEGLSPMLADLSGDGVDDVIVTESNADVGAQLVVYDLDGNTVARSEAIGTGNRWRHQIAVAPIGPAGELELVSVQTPHIGGIVQFHRLDDDRLVLVAELAQFGSHQLGSVNLDMAVVFDADDDGELEVVVPVQSRQDLAVLGRDETGVNVEALISFDGSTLTSNLAAVEIDGAVRFALGLSGGTLRVWSTAG